MLTTEAQRHRVFCAMQRQNSVPRCLSGEYKLNLFIYLMI